METKHFIVRLFRTPVFILLIWITSYNFSFSQSNCNVDYFYNIWVCIEGGCGINYDFKPLYSGTSPAYYCWDFGDNTFSHCGQQATLTIWDSTDYGVYPVCMVAYLTDSTSCDTICKNICIGVSDSTCTCWPTWGTYFTYSVDTVSNSVTFTNNTTNQGNYNYLWYFGDGDTSTSVSPVHTYLQNGIYSVCAKNDSASCSYTKCQNVLYDSKDSTYINLKLPQYNNQLINCAPRTYVLSVQGEAWGYNTQSDTLTINIFFGDGQDSIFKTKINSWNNTFNKYTKPHVYDFGGIYSPFITVTGPDGKYDTISYPNKIILSDTCGNISGKVYIDDNNNCIFDSIIDTELFNAPLELFQNNQFYNGKITDNYGNYWFSAPVGNAYILKTPSSYLSNTGYSVSCPSSGELNISVPSSNNNFSLNCSSDSFDIHGYLFNYGIIVPMQSCSFLLNLKNKNCFPVTSQIILKYPSGLTYISSSIEPAFVSGDSIFWNSIDDFTVSQTWSTGIIFSIDTILYPGDTICFIAYYLPFIGDENPEDNIDTICFPVLGPWDPNGKTVIPQGIGSNGNISPYTNSLTYDIHFQNTGSAPAINVSVIDTIDSNLDINTFQILSSSHDMKLYRAKNNILKFSFENIMLPDSASQPINSMGNVTYTISPKSNLPNGSQIKNTSYIYFDYNHAIVTNTVINTIDYGLSIYEITNKLSRHLIYPIPVANNLFLEIPYLKNPSFVLTDMLGRSTIMTYTYDNKYVFDISKFPNGIYTLQIIHEEQHPINEKIIIFK